MAKRTVLEELVVLITGDASNYSRVARQVENYTRGMTIQVNRMVNRVHGMTVRLATQAIRPLQAAFRNLSNAAMTMARNVQAAFSAMSRSIRSGVSSAISAIGSLAVAGRTVRQWVNTARQQFGYFRQGMQIAFKSTGLHPSAYRFRNLAGRFVAPPFLGRMGIRTGAAVNLAGMAASGLISAGGRVLAPVGRAGFNFMTGLGRGMVGSTRPLYTMAGMAGRFVGQVPWGFGLGLTGRPGARRLALMRGTGAHLGQALGLGTRSFGIGAAGGGRAGIGALGGIAGMGIGAIRGTAGLIRGIGGVAAKAGGVISNSLAKAFNTVHQEAHMLFNAITRHVRRLSYDFMSLGRTFTYFVALPIAGLGVSAVTAFAKFEDEMVKATAVMGGVHPTDKAAMESKVLGLAGSTITSDIASGYLHLASAGYEAVDAINLIGVTEKFAVASMTDMKSATDSLVDIQSALGLRTTDTAKNMENMTRVSDVLTKANQISNGTIENFADSLTHKGAAAIRLLGKDMTEGVAVLAAYASQGVKGADAGEKLYIMSRDLQRSAIKNSEAWTNMGISVFDSSGEMRNFADILQQLEVRLGRMSDEQKRVAFMTLGLQDRSLAATIQILGMSGAIRKYEEALTKAGGATKELADARMKSFSSQIMITWNQIRVAGIGIGKVLVPILEVMNSKIRDVIASWQSLTEPTRKWIVLTAMAATVLGPLVLSVGILGLAFSSVVNVIGLMSSIILGPLKAGISVVASITKHLVMLAGAAVIAATKIMVDLGAAIAKVFLNTMVSAVNVIVSGVSAIISWTIALGPVGAIMASIGTVMGFFAVVATGAATAISAFGAGLTVIGSIMADVVSLIGRMGGAVGRAINYLLSFVTTISSPKGVVGALISSGAAARQFANDAVESAKYWYTQAIGFAEHYTENMKKLWDWLEENWDVLMTGFSTAFKQVSDNMVHNFSIVGGALKDIAVEATGFMSVVFENLWIDFQTFAQNAMKYVIGKIVTFGITMASIIAKIPERITKVLTSSSDELDRMDAEMFRMASGFLTGGQEKKKLPDFAGNVGGIMSRAAGKLKGPTEGVNLNLPELPTFNTDLSDKVEKNIFKPIGMASGAAAVLHDELDEPFVARFKVEGLEGLKVGTAEAYAAMLNARSGMGGAATVGGGMPTSSPMSPTIFGGAAGPIPGLGAPDIGGMIRSTGGGMEESVAERKDRLLGARRARGEAYQKGKEARRSAFQATRRSTRRTKLVYMRPTISRIALEERARLSGIAEDEASVRKAMPSGVFTPSGLPAGTPDIPKGAEGQSMEGLLQSINENLEELVGNSEASILIKYADLSGG